EGISPVKRPLSIPVPLKVYLPSISEASSMKAGRSLPLTAPPLLPLVFFQSIVTGPVSAPRPGPPVGHRGGTRRGPRGPCCRWSSPRAASRLRLARHPLVRPLVIEQVRRPRCARGTGLPVDLRDGRVEASALGGEQPVRLD